MKISVITAVFNNRAHIAEALESVLAQDHADVERVVIDGGSTDGTLAALAPLAARERRLRVVVAPRGYGRQLLAGFAASRGRVVAYMDGDGQYDPAELPKFLAAPPGAVASARREENETGAARRLLSLAFSFLVSALGGLREPDVTSGLKALPGGFARGLRLRWGLSFLASTELMLAARRAGLAFAAVPVRCRRREAGRSKLLSARGALAVAADLARLLAG